MNEHLHSVEHVVQFPSGKTQEICECGASRYVFRGQADAWHTCKLCTHPWGLAEGQGEAMNLKRTAIIWYTIPRVRNTPVPWEVACTEQDTEETMRAHAAKHRPSIQVTKVEFDEGEGRRS